MNRRSCLGGFKTRTLRVIQTLIQWSSDECQKNAENITEVSHNHVSLDASCEKLTSAYRAGPRVKSDYTFLYFSADLVRVLRGRYKGLLIVIPCHCEVTRTHKTTSPLVPWLYRPLLWHADKEICFCLLCLACGSLPPMETEKSQVRQISCFGSRIALNAETVKTVEPSKETARHVFPFSRFRANRAFSSTVLF